MAQIRGIELAGGFGEHTDEPTPTQVHVITREWGERNVWERHEYTYPIDKIEDMTIQQGIIRIVFEDGQSVIHPLHVIQQQYTT